MSNKESIVRKAYEINLDKIHEGYHYEQKFCLADDMRGARKQLINIAKLHDMELKWGGAVTYLNLPVRRLPSHDIIKVNGVDYVRYKWVEQVAKAQRNKLLDDILNNPDIQYCYIYKGGFYRPNSCGYTSHMSEAGVYKKGEAVAHARGVQEIKLIPINIEEHNKMINEKIENLKSRLISHNNGKDFN